MHRISSSVNSSQVNADLFSSHGVSNNLLLTIEIVGDAIICDPTVTPKNDQPNWIKVAPEPNLCPILIGPPKLSVDTFPVTIPHKLFKVDEEKSQV